MLLGKTTESNLFLLDYIFKSNAVNLHECHIFGVLETDYTHTHTHTKLNWAGSATHAVIVNGN